MRIVGIYDHFMLRLNFRESSFQFFFLVLREILTEILIESREWQTFFRAKFEKKTKNLLKNNQT